MLYSRFSVVVYFMHSISTVYMPIPTSHFVPTPLLPLVPIRLFPMSVSLFFALQTGSSVPLLNAVLFSSQNGKYIFLFISVFRIIILFSTYISDYLLSSSLRSSSISFTNVFQFLVYKSFTSLMEEVSVSV